jgi:hypothetical protein
MKTTVVPKSTCLIHQKNRFSNRRVDFEPQPSTKTKRVVKSVKRKVVKKRKKGKKKKLRASKSNPRKDKINFYEKGISRSASSIPQSSDPPTPIFKSKPKMFGKIQNNNLIRNSANNDNSSIENEGGSHGYFSRNSRHAYISKPSHQRSRTMLHSYSPSNKSTKSFERKEGYRDCVISPTSQHRDYNAELMDASAFARGYATSNVASFGKKKKK